MFANKENGSNEYIFIFLTAISIYFLLNPSSLISLGLPAYYLYAFSICIASFMVMSLENKNESFFVYLTILGALVSVNILTRPMSFDDWSYIGASLDGLTLSKLLYPINGHQVPILQLILYSMDKLFSLHQISYQTALVLINILFIYSIYNFCSYFNYESNKIKTILLIWILWPSLSGARSWFGGGFWLCASACLFLHFIPFFDSLIKENKSDLTSHLKLITYVAALAGISSSYKFILLNLLPILIYYSYKKNKSVIFYSLYLFVIGFVISFISLRTLNINFLFYNPDKEIHWMQMPYYYILNMGYWLNAQIASLIPIGYSDVTNPWDPLPVINEGSRLFNIILGCLLLFGFIKIFRNYFKTPSNLPSCILIFNVLLFFFQIEIARGWDYKRILTGYYQILPTSFIIIALIPLIKIGARDINFKILKTTLVILSLWAYAPRIQTIQTLRLQQDFLITAGNTYCHIASKNNLERFIPPSPDLKKCTDCAKILNAPSVYVDSLINTDDYYYMLIKKIVMDACPTYSEKFLWHKHQSTDGKLNMKFIEEDEVWRKFTSKYFNK